MYSHYLKSIGWFLSISTIVMNAIFQSFSIGSSVWLSVWSNDQNQTNGNNTLDTAKRDMYLGVYGALGFGQGMFPYCVLIFIIYYSFVRFDQYCVKFLYNGQYQVSLPPIAATCINIHIIFLLQKAITSFNTTLTGNGT